MSQTNSKPKWLRVTNLIICGLIMLAAGFVSIKTQFTLASRIPDWAGFAWLIPVAVWLYAIQSTINWSAAKAGTKDRDEHLTSVKISVGLAEVMNVGEHFWSYYLEHGTITLGLTPTVLLGSLPAFLDFFSIHFTSKVLSSSTGPEITELELEAETAGEPSRPADPRPTATSEFGTEVELLRSEPVPPVVPAAAELGPAPTPEVQVAPEPVKEVEPVVEPTSLKAKQIARDRLVDEIALEIAGFLDGGGAVHQIKKVFKGPELAARFPDKDFTNRYFLELRELAIPVALDLVTKAA